MKALVLFIICCVLFGCYLTPEIIDLSKNEEEEIDSFLILLTPITSILDVLFIPFTFPKFLVEGLKGNWNFFKRPED